MKLKAEAIPYSSIVGTGIVFTDEKGKHVFQMNMLGFSGEPFEKRATSKNHDDFKRYLVDLADKIANQLDGLEIDD